MRLSYTSMSTYLRCPLQYKLGYVDKLPTKRTPALTFGSSLHAALHSFYNVSLPQPCSMDELLAKLEDLWESDGYRDMSEELSYLEHGKEVLGRFYAANVADFRVPVALEHKFRLPFDGFTFSGVIDRMDRLPTGGFEIIDYKTSKRLPPKSTVESDLQLSIYHLACEEIWGVAPEKLSLYFLIPNQKLSSSRTAKQSEETRALIYQTAEQIGEGRFEPVENRLCPWCDFQAHCPFRKHRTQRQESPDPVIEAVVDEYVDLKSRAKEILARADELGPVIHNYCVANGLTRVFGTTGSVSRTARVTTRYNPEKLREALEPHGLWSQVTKPDPALVRELVQDGDVTQEIKQLVEAARDEDSISYALNVRTTVEKSPVATPAGE